MWLCDCAYVFVCVIVCVFVRGWLFLCVVVCLCLCVFGVVWVCMCLRCMYVRSLRAREFVCLWVCLCIG